MRRVFKVILWIAAILIGLPVLAVLALDIALNTGAGRNFAAHEINALSGGTVRITGLAGHFPKYIAARRIAIADRKGRYLVIDDAVLRWSPFALLHRTIDISDLTAKRIDILRQPVPAAAKPKPKPKQSARETHRHPAPACARSSETEAETIRREQHPENLAGPGPS